MKKLIGRLFSSLGFEIIRKRSPLESNLNLDEHLGYDYEDEATECIKIVRNNTMLSKRRLVTLYHQAVYCEKHDVPGAYVECGVWKGGAVGLMALANLRRGRQRRHIHLFDAFQEICEPDESVDGQKAIQEVQMWAKGGMVGERKPLVGFYDSFGGPGTLDENRQLLEDVIGYDRHFLHYHRGWFQDTLPVDAATIGNIAILRLDGDWYASTKICLEYLFEKVVRGGIVIVDDYGTYEGCKLAVDEFMEKEKIQALLGHIDSDCRYWVKL